MRKLVIIYFSGFDVKLTNPILHMILYYCNSTDSFSSWSFNPKAEATSNSDI